MAKLRILQNRPSYKQSNALFNGKDARFIQNYVPAKIQQDGDLEIQQNSQPDSKTYFFSMRPRRSELFNQKLIRMIKSLSS